MSISRLRQPKKRGEQLRLLPAAEMPPSLLRPPEKNLVARLRAALSKMGYLHWSGRVAVYDPSPAAHAARLERGWPPFLPALEPGTPDILGVFPRSSGRLFGLECKRAESDEERRSQIAWRRRAEAWGVFVETVRSVEEGIAAVERGRLWCCQRPDHELGAPIAAYGGHAYGCPEGWWKR